MLQGLLLLTNVHGSQQFVSGLAISLGAVALVGAIARLRPKRLTLGVTLLAAGYGTFRQLPLSLSAGIAVFIWTWATLLCAWQGSVRLWVWDAEVHRQVVERQHAVEQPDAADEARGGW